MSESFSPDSKATLAQLAQTLASAPEWVESRERAARAIQAGEGKSGSQLLAELDAREQARRV